jgi:hypothetical protein
MRLADKISLWAAVLVAISLMAMMAYGHTPP